MKCTKKVQSRVLSERDVNKFNGPRVYLQLGKVELLKYFNTTINHQPSTINHQPSISFIFILTIQISFFWLGSCKVTQQIWARLALSFWRYLDINGQTNKLNKQMFMQCILCHIKTHAFKYKFLKNILF